MKLFILLGLCAVAAAAPKLDAAQAGQREVDLFNSHMEPRETIVNDLIPQLFSDLQERNILINMLIRQLFTYIRHVINNGSSLLGVGPMDPLNLEEIHLVVPAGLVNMDLHLKNVLMTGLGGFLVHTSNVNFNTLTFDVEISVPKLVIRAEQYDFVGDLFTAIPLYGKGGAEFIAENFRFRALAFIKQSEDGASILIDRIESPSFEIPSFKSNLDGVIGGGDIDAIVNAMIEDVIIDYVNRFQGAIAKLAASLAVTFGNPILNQLDSWRYIRPFVPTQNT